MGEIKGDNKNIWKKNKSENKDKCYTKRSFVIVTLHQILA
jgi:hypothetical protein